MQPLSVYIRQPRVILFLIIQKLNFLFPDNLYLQLLYYFNTGNILHLKCPQTFGEKIQWLKLYDRKPEYTMLVDKYAVKDYVARIIGEEYVIPTLGVWDRPEDINFDELPRHFVLKATHLGGGDVIICRDKALFDKKKAVKKLRRALRGDIYKTYREWPYKNVPRRIIAEKYIENSYGKSQDLTDYKFYCFNGAPMFCQVIMDRHTKETIDFFDLEWHHQPFFGLNPIGKPSSIEPEKPIHLDEMIRIANKLSKDTFFSRIDLYDTPAGPLFGEITFYPASGMGVFTPNKYNTILGEMIKLPR